MESRKRCVPLAGGARLAGLSGGAGVIAVVIIVLVILILGPALLPRATLALGRSLRGVA